MPCGWRNFSISAIGFMEWQNRFEARPALEAIRRIVATDPAWAASIKTLPKGSILLKEGEQPEQLLLILEGDVTLHKDSPLGPRISVDKLEGGDLLGILSYVAREQVYVGAVAASPVKAFVINWEQFEHMRSSHPELHGYLHDLTIENLARRYRRMVRLHLDLAAVNHRLEEERAELRATLAELERTGNRLVHQEKLATLGQLTAGLAHEINNPAAALIRSADYLKENIGSLVRADGGNKTAAAARLWEMGLGSATPDSENRRQRMETLAARFPHLPRPLVRRMSILPDEALQLMVSAFSRRMQKLTEQDVHHGILHFEAGYYLRSLGIAAERIQRLVISLRNYNRRSSLTFEPVDVREGLQDTLLIVANRLKNVAVELQLNETPPVAGDAGELNQVWTNLIVNACDAMSDSGRLRIECGQNAAGRIFVTIADSGPGVPDELRARIFEPNFTTKTNATNFGLGLGLAISRDIILKHDGELRVENGSEGGAVFTVLLPAA
jgi:signal transduction histidine kinase